MSSLTRLGPIFASLCLNLLMSAFAAPQAMAQMFTDPLTSTNGRSTHVAGVFSSSDIEYEEDGISDDVERKVLGVEAATSLSSSLDGFAQVGLILDTEIDNLDDDGSGFTFGAGAKSIVHRESGYRVSAYGFFSYQTEEIEEGDLKVELDTYDLHGGGVVGFAASPLVTPYAGLDLVLLSDGDVKVKVNGATGKDDIERDDTVNLKLGGLFNLTSALLRAEVTLLGEQTFTLAVGKLL